MPWCLANPSPPSGWVENLHLQAAEHAWHTKKTATVGEGGGNTTGAKGELLTSAHSSHQEPYPWGEAGRYIASCAEVNNYIGKFFPILRGAP